MQKLVYNIVKLFTYNKISLSSVGILFGLYYYSYIILLFKEFGTELAALNCTIKNCSGRVLPVNPLNKLSVWQCKECCKLVTSVEIMSFFKRICSLMNSIQQCPKRLETILKTFNIYKNNTFVVDLRLKFIWKSKNNSKIWLFVNLRYIFYHYNIPNICVNRS